jgi:hypothetical protein
MFYGGGWCIFVSWLCRPFTESRGRYRVKEKELERYSLYILSTSPALAMLTHVSSP